MIWRTACLLTSLIGISANHVLAEQFLVRVETKGYLDAPLCMAEPPDELLRSIETLAVPGERFYCKAIAGKEMLIISGRLQSCDDGSFTLESLSYVYEKDTGEMGWSSDGKRIKRPYRTSTETSASAELGTPHEFSSLRSMSNPDQPDGTRSKERDLVMLIRYGKDR